MTKMPYGGIVCMGGKCCAVDCCVYFLQNWHILTILPSHSIFLCSEVRWPLYDHWNKLEVLLYILPRLLSLYILYRLRNSLNLCGKIQQRRFPDTDCFFWEQIPLKEKLIRYLRRFNK